MTAILFVHRVNAHLAFRTFFTATNYPEPSALNVLQAYPSLLDIPTKPEKAETRQDDDNDCGTLRRSRQLVGLTPIWDSDLLAKRLKYVMNKNIRIDSRMSKRAMHGH